jgi:sugar lactone lactonase YvrE
VLVTPDGGITPVGDGLAFPNGMAISPDSGTLIVAESYCNRLTAYYISPGGSLAGRQVPCGTHGSCRRPGTWRTG